MRIIGKYKDRKITLRQYSTDGYFNKKAKHDCYRLALRAGDHLRIAAVGANHLCAGDCFVTYLVHRLGVAFYAQPRYCLRLGHASRLTVGGTTTLTLRRNHEIRCAGTLACGGVAKPGQTRRTQDRMRACGTIPSRNKSTAR